MKRSLKIRSFFGKGAILMAAIFVIGAGCGRYHSEFDAPRGTLSKVDKPVCDFKPEQTCWMRDMSLLQECSGDAKVIGEQIFTSEFRSCDNYRGRKIIFEKSSMAALAAHPGGDFLGKLSYTLYDREPPCFEFEGTSSNFVITSAEHGQLSYGKDPEGNIRVQCFGGELMTIPVEATQVGCANSSVAPADFIPSLRTHSSITEPEEIWVSTFSGLGEGSSYDMFRCVHKGE